MDKYYIHKIVDENGFCIKTLDEYGGFILSTIELTKSSDNPNYIRDSIPTELVKPKWDFNNLIWIEGASASDYSSKYSDKRNEFIFNMKKALWLKFNQEKDWQVIRHRDEIDMGLSEASRSLTNAEYTALLQEKWATRNAVSQLEYYAGYMNADILFLSDNLDLSNAMDANIIGKDLTPIEVSYTPDNTDSVSLNSTTLSIGAVDITNINKGDFIFVCDDSLVRVNVFTDANVTDLSTYISVQLWGWVGVQKIKYAVSIV